MLIYFRSEPKSIAIAYCTFVQFNHVWLSAVKTRLHKIESKLLLLFSAITIWTASTHSSAYLKYPKFRNKKQRCKQWRWISLKANTSPGLIRFGVRLNCWWPFNIDPTIWVSQISDCVEIKWKVFHGLEGLK